MPEKRDDRRRRIRIIVTVLVAAAAAPAAIFLGVSVWNDRRFYLVSLIIMLLSAVPFVLRFERKKLRPRELVVLAAMIAIGVAGRAAFYMLPQFKPIIAVAIITGIAFGADSGFIAGAMIAFVSNFMFVQGPWTPWQMEALGLTGLLGGLFFHRKNAAPPKTVPLVIFGVLSVLLVYGPIVDTSTLLTTYSDVTWELAGKVFAAGVPFNLINAAATAIFLLLLAKPLLKKLKRVQVKYGLLE